MGANTTPPPNWGGVFVGKPVDGGLHYTFELKWSEER
jgi:hypothetical protein